MQFNDSEFSDSGHLHAEVAHRRHWEAAGPWAVASGREAGLGHPGEGTWCRAAVVVCGAVTAGALPVRCSGLGWQQRSYKRDVGGGAGDPLGRVRCHKILAGGPQRRLQVRDGQRCVGDGWQPSQEWAERTRGGCRAARVGGCCLHEERW